MDGISKFTSMSSAWNNNLEKIEMEQDHILRDQLNIPIDYYSLFPNYPLQHHPHPPSSSITCTSSGSSSSSLLLAITPSSSFNSVSTTSSIPLGFSDIRIGKQLVEMVEEEDQDNQEEGEEELGAMKEMMYKIAAMQPVDIDPSTIRKPKRRNVRISDDPQSVAARHRRERISERIRILQRLVPGGSKMDTASMLDEAIRYVKFLKRQIRLLQSNQNQSHHPQSQCNIHNLSIHNNNNNIVSVSGFQTSGGDHWPFFAPNNKAHGSVTISTSSSSLVGHGFKNMGDQGYLNKSDNHGCLVFNHEVISDNH